MSSHRPSSATHGAASPEPAGRAPRLRRILPLAILAAGLALVLAAGLDDYLSIDTLQRHRNDLLAWVQARRALAGVAYVAVYALATALSIPGGAVLTIAGGFLFGTVLATACAVIGATIGATVLFLAARSALGDLLRRRVGGGVVRRMEEGFRENALSYMLVLRLVPIFPFWLVNLVPAFLGVPLRTYVLGTALGIIPGTVIFASLGAGLGAVFEAGDQPDLGILFSPQVLWPIVGLSLLTLLPVAYRRWRRWRSERGGAHG